MGISWLPLLDNVCHPKKAGVGVLNCGKVRHRGKKEKEVPSLSPSQDVSTGEAERYSRSCRDTP